jgi:hypothetical protein
VYLVQHVLTESREGCFAIFVKSHFYYDALVWSLCMPSILQKPLVHYGLPAVSASIVVLIAFVLLDGTIQLAALGIAAVELLVAPQILKRAA